MSRVIIRQVQALRMKRLLQEGERILEWDFISLRVRYHDESKTRNLGTAVITFTSSAIHLQPRRNPTVTRIPYENINDLVEQAPQTVFRTKTAHYILVSRPRWFVNIYDTLARQLGRVEVARYSVEFEGDCVVLLTLRPVEEQGTPVWLVHVFGNIDLADPSNQSRIEKSLDPALLANHPLPAWPGPSAGPP
jgi:hypothetical protein